MKTAYLTIDDTPNERSRAFLDALVDRHAPALLFCRGDMIEKYPDAVVYAIQKGFVIGNHGYHHTRATTLGFDATCDNILRADMLIEKCYADAGVPRPGKYYRFAYMDRGMGAWFVEPESVPVIHRAYVAGMIREGLGNDPVQLPSAEQVETKNALQAFLKAQGYTKTPFENVRHEFYTDSEMADAIDAMFTYSTADWAMTARHRDKGVDVFALMDADPHLSREDTAHVILAHDQAEIHVGTLALIDKLITMGFVFRDIQK